MVEAIASATAKIVEGSSEKGASFALNLKVRAGAEILEKGKGIKGTAPKELKKLAVEALALFDLEDCIELKIDNYIPEKAGLGEAEASCVATVLAVAGAVAKKHGSVNELKVDKYVKEQFFLLGRRLVNKKKLIDLCIPYGDFDRIFASFYGGFAVTDNRKNEVLRRGEMESMDYVLSIPKKKKADRRNDLLLYKNETDLMWDEALKGNLYGAMKLNSLLYCDDSARKMMKAGALTATVSYPASIALTRDEKKLSGIEKAVKGSGKILSGKVCNEAAKVLVKPRRIVRTKEFMEIKGGDEYFFL